MITYKLIFLYWYIFQPWFFCEFVRLYRFYSLWRVNLYIILIWEYVVLCIFKWCNWSSLAFNGNPIYEVLASTSMIYSNLSLNDWSFNFHVLRYQHSIFTLLWDFLFLICHFFCVFRFISFHSGCLFWLYLYWLYNIRHLLIKILDLAL